MDDLVSNLAIAQGHVIRNPIVIQDGGFHVAIGNRPVPLLAQGAIVTTFLPGWRASHLYTGFAPLFLLELANDDGRRATWFLDFRMQNIADAVGLLSQDRVDLLRQKAVPLLARLMRAMLQDCMPVLDADCLDFLSINHATRQAIAVNCLDLVLRPPGTALVEQLSPASLLFHDNAHGGLHAIDRHHLAEALGEEFQDRAANAFASGALELPSPVDGEILRAQGGFCFDDFHFAYRFADIRHDLVFFMIVCEHHSRAIGLWFPSLGLMVSRDERDRTLATNLLRHLPYWFVTHSCQWGALLAPYLHRGATRFASVMRGRPGVHIGHQLWNELSGIDRLLHRQPDSPPEWIVLNATDGIELYGPIDRLFPALRGHVNRELLSIPAMIRYAYEQGVTILRVTSEYVTASLRERILGEIRGGAAALTVDRIIAGRLVILVGLRVENRTLTDLTGFLANLIAFISSRHPDTIIVLDGHNSRGDADGGNFIESHGEFHAGRQPVDIEHEIARNLRARFHDQPVTILDTIGLPIANSLLWADRSTCFVSVWGASLAKYRWVCNKPGFAITSHSNLLHRGDLHIYDSTASMEAPTDLRFVDPALVTDRPDAPLLVNVNPGNPSFFNFEVDEARLFDTIGEMLQEHLRKTITVPGANLA